MKITESYLKKEIEKLTKERSDFMNQANNQVAAMNGAIQLAEQMLDRLRGKTLPKPESNGEGGQVAETSGVVEVVR